MDKGREAQRGSVPYNKLDLLNESYIFYFVNDEKYTVLCMTIAGFPSVVAFEFLDRVK
jgi:hypothetical protein